MNGWDSFEKSFPLLAMPLKNAAQRGRLSHSLLVVSANPDIRLSFPPVLAALSACTNRREDGAPCGDCSACRSLAAGTYPDLFTLAPTSKAREITVGKDDGDPDTLRSFESVFHLGSITESGWKIGIIQEADTMNEAAQNAFLKTLEEPPPKCLFILSTGRPGALLPTIRSRCQTIPLTDNVCIYDMELFAPAAEALLTFSLKANRDLVEAEECAVRLIRILDSLETAAEETVTKRWDARLKEAENLESAGLKLLERRIAGETSCEYRRLREQFISFLHAWFAELAELSAGIDPSLLPNPEVVRPWLGAEDKPKLRERDAFRILSEAETLVKNLRTNVNDELAIRTFILKTAARR